MKRIRAICREIELLCPTVDDGGRRPDNTEYPWFAHQGVVIAPCKFKFVVEGRLDNTDGKMLLKIAASVVQDLAGK